MTRRLSREERQRPDAVVGANLLWLQSVVANPPDDCAMFPGGLDRPCGYGRVWVDGRDVPAHRLAYTLAHGPIPPGMWVLHRCVRSRPCCNPRHLYLGTRADNAADMVRDGTAKHLPGQNRPYGAMRTTAKLTEPDVHKIHQMLEGGARQRDVARLFGISQSRVSRVHAGKEWNGQRSNQ